MLQAAEITESVFRPHLKGHKPLVYTKRFVPDSDDEGYVSVQEKSVCWYPARKTNKFGDRNPHYRPPLALDLTMGDISHLMDSKDFLVCVETNPGPYNIVTL